MLQRLSSPRHRIRLLLALTFALGAIPRIYLAFYDDGIYWPDELAKSVEQAHRLVFGYGNVPWEFVQGAVNWTFPALLAGLLRLVTWVGLESPSEYLVALRLCIVSLSFVAAYGAYRLAKAYGEDSEIGLFAALFFLWSPATIYFSTRALSEVVSAAPVAFGLAYCLRPAPRESDADRRRTREIAVGALLIGFSVLLRLHNALFAFGVIAVLLARRQWKNTATAGVCLAASAVLLGAIDALTWHRWFNSAIVYLNFSLVQNRAVEWGIGPWWFYLDFFYRTMGPVSIIMAGLILLGVRRAPSLGAVAALVFAAHSATGHKEARLVYPLIPVLCALAALGAGALRSQLTEFRLKAGIGPAMWNVFVALVLASSLYRLARFHDLSWADVKQDGSGSAYDGGGNENRLLLAASSLPDLCGIREETHIWSFTGGYAYLHRRVPFYDESGPAPESAFYNYAISRDPNGGQVVARQGDVVLKKIRGDCVRDPGYRSRHER